MVGVDTRGVAGDQDPTLHYGRMYTRGSFDKAPAPKRADSLRTEARAQLHALDHQRLIRTAAEPKIAAVNSRLQRSPSCCVAKARARLFLERLKLVTPANAPAQHRGTTSALGMIIGRQADWEAAHDYRPLTRW